MLLRLAFVAFLLAPALAPTLAQAHAILMASDPPSGGTVAPGATILRLQYNSRIDQGRSRVTLTRPAVAKEGAQGAAQGGDGMDERLKLRPAERPDVLRADATLAPGDYVLHWFVLATDGHITRGDVPFTVGKAVGDPGDKMGDQASSQAGDRGQASALRP